ncbi:RDD family protein [Amycolatopsis cihanbeyliensis]|uniref:Putative RDD family membrane protein YckC n=1 Tax=Amycolatopsis cihanbeyliensis TaxID=1128664 RepID=A0A542DPA9_AMYCI|nr:RDD family protein [Amycolatopsis cihanbeyliensis]TQJ04929.1 putative RDD family membrane protein YckC [Amycolatopsis cihanbeyliensis]
MPRQSELITGDAVVLDLRVARLASRCLAFCLDVLLQAALLLGVLLLLNSVGGVDGTLLTVIMLVLVVLVVVGYPTIAETLSRGRTLGKLALGLRVVRDDGGPVRLRHALTRALAAFFVDFWALGLLGAVAFVVSFCSKDGKRVGDFLAGTLVVRERVPASDAPVIAMPPPLAEWASRLDLTGLSDDLALAARQYLGRYGELNEQARQQLGGRLAEDVARAIGAPIPMDAPPWAYLSAVLAERRAREHARHSGYRPSPYQPPAQDSGGTPPEPPGPFAPPG